jgi:hypothetical protein
MKKLFFLLLSAISLSATAQSDTIFYNGIVDYDGQKRRTANWTGYWTYSNSDSTLTHYSDGTLFQYHVEKSLGHNYEYVNEWGDHIRITFMELGVLKKCIERPEPYLIYQRKKK